MAILLGHKHRWPCPLGLLLRVGSSVEGKMRDTSVLSQESLTLSQPMGWGNFLLYLDNQGHLPTYVVTDWFSLV